MAGSPAVAALASNVAREAGRPLTGARNGPITGSTAVEVSSVDPDAQPARGSSVRHTVATTTPTATPRRNALTRTAASDHNVAATTATKLDGRATAGSYARRTTDYVVQV